jgi:hypothetical protein
MPTLLHRELTSGVHALESTRTAFAALKHSGSLVSWVPASPRNSPIAVLDQIVRLQGDPVGAMRALSGFVAVTSDNRMTSWSADEPEPWASIPATALPLGTIAANYGAFAAIGPRGQVATWGEAASGGDSTPVARRLRHGVQSIATTPTAFAALRRDGSVVTWGDPDAGGDSRDVARHLRSGVVSVFANDWAFAAIKRDGSVISWGNPDGGGDSRAVADRLGSDVLAIYPGSDYFVAIKSDGTAAAWGGSEIEVAAANRASDLAPPWVRLTGTVPGTVHRPHWQGCPGAPQPAVLPTRG